MEYLKALLEKADSSINTIVATGQNERNKSLVKQYFNLDGSFHQTTIALCSDAMSEGINLQDAKALVLLDMPSVLRVIEQRIGRLERMDSEHKEIYVFWPNDSTEFSLNGDKRIVDLLLMTDDLIGNNVGIPKVIFEKYFKEDYSTEKFMRAYTEYSADGNEWEGVTDSTQSLYSLIEGNDALIDKETYNEFKDVDSTVKSAISFVEVNKGFSFFAFRGDTTRSPKWLFIDERNKPFTDFNEITNKLKEYIGGSNVVQRRWNEVDLNNEIKNIIQRLRRQEKNLLPNKKKRALAIGERLLRELAEKMAGSSDKRTTIVEKLLLLFDLDTDASECIDFNHFSELWLSVLLPSLDNLKKAQKRKRRILTLQNLKLKDVPLDEEKLSWLLERAQYSYTLDEIIAACIIGIS